MDHNSCFLGGPALHSMTLDHWADCDCPETGSDLMAANAV